MKSFIQILSILLALSSFSFAQEHKSNPQSKQQWEQFNTQNEQSLRIVWDQHSGKFSKMIGKTTESYGSTQKEAVVQFIEQNRSLLGIQENDFGLIQTKEVETQSGAHKYTYQQHYKGVPVLHSGYLISVAEGGFIDYLSGDFYDDIALDIAPKISSSDVTGIIVNDIDTNNYYTKNEPLLSIYPNHLKEEISYNLVYSIDVYLENESGAWRFFVDAVTGNVIEKMSLLSHGNITEINTSPSLVHQKKEPVKSKSMESFFLINGSGTVYTTSPNFSGTSVQTLHRLNNLSPRKLKGDNINVEYYNNTNASSSSGFFNYSTSNAHFDEVMVYYHSDEFEAWLIGKGMGNSQVGKVTAKTRWHTGYAYAISDQRKVFFQGAVSGLNNPTKEAAVIAHEYMHVVSETYNDLLFSTQTRAMDEAYSDYFGLTYRNTTGSLTSSIIGEYIDQSGGYNYTRNLNNSWTMDDYNSIDLEPNFTVNQHDRSVIFSGALWDLRNDPNVNAGVVDELVLASLANLDSSPSYLDGMYALIAAANTAGRSSYVDDIEDAFIGKKIYTPSPPPPSFTVTVSGPSNMFEYSSATFTANVSGGSSPFSYDWYYRNEPGGSWTFVPSATTNSYYHTASSASGQTIKAVVTDNNSNTDEDEHYFTIFGSGFKIVNPGELPETFAMDNNYPNPFNPTTKVKYSLPEAADVTLKVYNIMGQEVATLINSNVNAGFQEVTFEADDLPSGVYIARMKAVGQSGATFTKELKMQLIK